MNSSDVSQPTEGKKTSVARRLGLGAFSISLLVHGIFAIIAVVFLYKWVYPPKKEVDFQVLGGGGGGSGGQVVSQRKTQRHQTMANATMRKIAVQGTTEFTLPDTSAELMDSALPVSADTLGGAGSGGGTGGGKGVGSGTGIGGNIGSGVGIGGNAGIKMFGLDLKVKSIGVVLDVSGSMTPHLKRVVDEVNRVAGGSPVILHVGCGIREGRDNEQVKPVTAPSDGFKKFWYLHHDALYKDQQFNLKTEVDLSRPIPKPEVYGILATRPKTYYYIGGKRVGSTGDALLADELRGVEAIYWFADFQDQIDPEEAGKVQKALSRRKQKLFIHASAEGKFLSNARDLLSLPTGGSQLPKSADMGKDFR